MRYTKRSIKPCRDIYSTATTPTPRLFVYQTESREARPPIPSKVWDISSIFFRGKAAHLTISAPSHLFRFEIPVMYHPSSTVLLSNYPFPPLCKQSHSFRLSFNHLSPSHSHSPSPSPSPSSPHHSPLPCPRAPSSPLSRPRSRPSIPKTLHSISYP